MFVLSLVEVWLVTPILVEVQVSVDAIRRDLLEWAVAELARARGLVARPPVPDAPHPRGIDLPRNRLELKEFLDDLHPDDWPMGHS